MPVFLEIIWVFVWIMLKDMRMRKTNENCLIVSLQGGRGQKGRKGQAGQNGDRVSDLHYKPDV